MATHFPQRGGCLCGDIRYSLVEDPVTVYVCHCTDCQRQTGTSFAMSMVVRRAALHIERGRAEEPSIELPDGRVARPGCCGRCSVRLWEISRIQPAA